MLDKFYEYITHETIELRKYGKEKFDGARNTPYGFLGVALQDTTTLMIGIQNIVAINLGRDMIKMDFGSPKSINDPENNIFSALKGIHRYFFISVLSSMDASGERICENKNISNKKGEKAFNKALQFIENSDREEIKTFYDSIKILRNECAHSSTGKVHHQSTQKIKKAGLVLLVSGNEIKVNCGKYNRVVEIAYNCISKMDSYKNRAN